MIQVQRLPAPHRQHDATVVFIHHYGGNSRSFRRHFQWFNNQGYDVVTFDLPSRDLRHLQGLPIAWNMPPQPGLVHVWDDAIAEALAQVAGPKIVYSFSFPSAAALLAMKRLGFQKSGIKAWICDGGPFYNVRRGIRNLVEVTGIKSSLPTPLFNFIAFYAMVGFSYARQMGLALRAMPQGFPILSLRYPADQLVHPKMIENFFALAKCPLALTKVEIPDVDHLQGLKKAPDLYSQAIKNFLSTFQNG